LLSRPDGRLNSSRTLAAAGPTYPRRRSAAAVAPSDVEPTENVEPTDASLAVIGFSSDAATNKTSSHDDVGLSKTGRRLKPGKNVAVLL
jgi:hypothetical protein